MLREAVILFDELDSLFVDRELLKPDSIINFLVPAMLPKIQTLSKRAKKQRLLIVIATNFYDRLDPAMVRRGRIDKHLLVLPYNDRSRTRQLSSLLKDSPKVMDSKRFIGKFNTSTRLYVFEELNAVSKVIEDRAEKWTNKADFEFEDYSPSAINPSIYWSRLPPDGIAVSRVRSTQRLALEVCEVGGRLLNEKRNLASSSERDTIAKRLAELEEKLSMAGHTEWSSLCKKLGFRLRSIQPDPAK
jgi:SpoVK/Ycf46/Vps4 family AAA+-type ATPase